MVVVEKASETSSEILWTYRIVQLFKVFFAEVLTYDCIFLASISATSFIKTSFKKAWGLKNWLLKYLSIFMIKIAAGTYESRYSRMDQVKFVEDTDTL